MKIRRGHLTLKSGAELVLERRGRDDIRITQTNGNLKDTPIYLNAHEMRKVVAWLSR